MPCIDPRIDSRGLRAHLQQVGVIGVFALLAACASRPTVVPAPTTEVVPVLPTPVQPAPGAPEAGRMPRQLPTPVSARTWGDFKKQAALRLVAATPDGTYITEAPDPLLAIPVLEVELNSDGSVRRIDVLRYPRQARDTTQLAIDAVKRAQPFGDMRHLSKPWKFTEAFLFDDNRRFKPRTLDE
ncbi:MAG TPA: hypothetical protein VFP68_13735 [Burkholderiaceae bacterium]|nr:hypothetical protein [Burkholderiaceae bacterium]